MSHLAYAQKVTDYRIVKVVGVVEDQVTKKPLKTGDVIPSDRKLKFESRTAYIVVSSPETGRKKISGVPDQASRELFELFQSFVQPDLVSTASRAISMEYLERLQASLTHDTLLILSPGYISIDTSKLSLKKPAVVRGWHHVNNKVKYERISDNAGIRLDKSALFGSHSHRAMPRVIIEYFENEAEDPVFAPGVLIAAFVPLYVEEDLVADEVRALISARDQDDSTSKTFEEIRAYLSAEYAAPQEDNLWHWLSTKGILTQ